MDFGRWLYTRRREAGLSQEVLARRAGCSKNYISRLERAIRHPVTGAPPQPSRKIVEGIALALGVHPAEALRAAGYLPEVEVEDVPATWAYYATLSSGRRAVADEVIRSLWLQDQREETTHGRKAE